MSKPLIGRIRVTKFHDARLIGATGHVVRRLLRDDSAWVDMDAELPPGLSLFPAGDHRRRWIILLPRECEKETQETLP